MDTTQQTPVFVTIESTDALLLALEFSKREYCAACDRQAEAWHLYEEAIDDGDREAITDLLSIAKIADMQQADAYQGREAAYAAYWGKVN